MDRALLSAIAAILGSLVGASATIATGWLTQRSQARRVLAAADRTSTQIIERFFGPNLSPEELRQLVLTRPDDPLQEFSEVCRRELRALQRSI